MLFSLIGIAIFSGFVGFLWLSLALIVQVIIDKIMIQGDVPTVLWFGTIAGLILIFVSGLELALAVLATNLTDNGVSLLTLKASIELPRVLLNLALMAYYNFKFTGLACLLAVLLSGAYFFLLQQRIPEATVLSTAVQAASEGIFPISSRVMLAFAALPVFLYGSTLVIQFESTIGQLIAFSIVNLLFTISALNIVNAAV